LKDFQRRTFGGESRIQISLYGVCSKATFYLGANGASAACRLS
jgi:hypothetical protein